MKLGHPLFKVWHGPIYFQPEFSEPSFTDFWDTQHVLSSFFQTCLTASFHLINILKGFMNVSVSPVIPKLATNFQTVSIHKELICISVAPYEQTWSHQRTILVHKYKDYGYGEIEGRLALGSTFKNTLPAPQLGCKTPFQYKIPDLNYKIWAIL
jgi:hypothetical protein